MNLFETIVLIFSGLTMLGSIAAMWVKFAVEIAKLQVELKNFQHDLEEKEKAILKLEKSFNDQFEKMFNKLDELKNGKI